MKFKRCRLEVVKTVITVAFIKHLSEGLDTNKLLPQSFERCTHKSQTNILPVRCVYCEIMVSRRSSQNRKSSFARFGKWPQLKLNLYSNERAK